MKAGTDLWLLPLAGDRKLVPYVQTTFNEGLGQVSADGRWMAYQSDESGRARCTARPAAGGKWQLSTQGGTQPRWRQDGTEIFSERTEP